MMTRLILLMWMPLLICGCAGGSGIRIGVSESKDWPAVVIVSGVDAGALDSFDEIKQEQREGVLRVWVAEAQEGMPPLLGDVTRRGGTLVFTPRYPFRPGVKYRARFDPGLLGEPRAAVVN